MENIGTSHPLWRKVVSSRRTRRIRTYRVLRLDGAFPRREATFVFLLPFLASPSQPERQKQESQKRCQAAALEGYEPIECSGLTELSPVAERLLSFFCPSFHRPLNPSGKRKNRKSGVEPPHSKDDDTIEYSALTQLHESHRNDPA